MIKNHFVSIGCIFVVICLSLYCMKQQNSIFFILIIGVAAAIVATLIFYPIPKQLILEEIEETAEPEKPTRTGYADSEKTIELFNGEITNPTTGDKQAYRIYTPSVDGLPAVILIPGGVGNGADFEKENGEFPSDAITVAKKGFVVVVYDPLGRGKSEGEINFQGYDDQDGLLAIIEMTKQFSYVDTENIGLASFSYGVTAAAGLLARYPDSGIKFWSDWEGPSSRSYTNPNCTGSLKDGELPTPGSFSCANDEYWLEREAAEFIKTAKVDYYWRIQQVDDHVQDTYAHTVEMVNNALSNDLIANVLLNDMPKNTAVTLETVEPAPNGPKLILYVIPHLLEMANN